MDQPLKLCGQQGSSLSIPCQMKDTMHSVMEWYHQAEGGSELEALFLSSDEETITPYMDLVYMVIRTSMKYFV